MLQVKDFNDACSRHFRDVMLVIGITVGMMFAGFAVTIACRDFLHEWLTKVFGEVAGEAMQGSILLLPAIVVMFGGVVWCEAKARGVAEMCCPNCKKPLVRHRHLVVAAKHCPLCGVRVLADLGAGGDEYRGNT